jgi:DNA-binding CsgD family transcriptional regulator
MKNLNNRDIQLINLNIQKLYSLCTLSEFPEWVMMLLENLVASEESFCASFTTQVNMMAGTMKDTWGNVATPEYLRDNPALQNYLEKGDFRPGKISDYISDQEFLNREGLYETLLLHYGMRDQLGFMISDSCRSEEQLSLFEEILCDRLKAFKDGSICVDDKAALLATVADPTTFYQNETLGHLSIGFHRSKRSFTERDRTILTILMPHLKIAYRNAQEYTRLQRQLQRQNQVFDQLNAVKLTVEGDVQLMSASAGNMLHRYFDGEYLDSNQLPDTLNSWVKQQLRMQQSEILMLNQPLQIVKSGQTLEIKLLCDFTDEQHLLIFSEQSMEFPLEQHLQSIGLSKREAEVLALVAAGKTNLQISLQLNISVKTVKKHLEHIFEKLNAQNRIDAVNKALKRFTQEGL